MHPRAYPTLDLLRVAAITMTILAHVTSVTFNVPGLRELKHGMWLGVDLFMLISGWLLGGQLLRERHVRPWRFWFKRWMRTLPPYYAMLLLLHLGSGRLESASLGDLAVYFLFLQEYTFDDNLYFVSWSLCVEEHFYLLLPLLVALIRRAHHARYVLYAVILLELLAIVGRLYAFSGDTDGIPMVTHLRWHGLYLGVLFAYLAHRRHRWWDAIGRYSSVLGVAGVVLTVLLMASQSPPFNHWMFVWTPTLGTWTLAMVFVACVHPSCSWSRVTFPGLRYAGELTYALYLTHAVIPKAWLPDAATHGAAVAYGSRFALMLLCAMALHHAVERPFLWLRARILGSVRHPDK